MMWLRQRYGFVNTTDNSCIIGLNNILSAIEISLLYERLHFNFVTLTDFYLRRPQIQSFIMIYNNIYIIIYVLR